MIVSRWTPVRRSLDGSHFWNIMSRKKPPRHLRLVKSEEIKKWQVFFYLDRGKGDEIDSKISALPRRISARIEAALDSFEENGFKLPPKMLTPTSHPKIKEIVADGEVAARVLLCRGPGRRELTVLFVATERDRKYVPSDAIKRAVDRREEVFADPQRRRIERHAQET